MTTDNAALRKSTKGTLFCGIQEGNLACATIESCLVRSGILFGDYLFCLILSSAVAFSEGRRVIGVAAKERHVSNVQNTVTSVKRYMGLQRGQKLLEQELIVHPPLSRMKVSSVGQNSHVSFQVRRLYNLCKRILYQRDSAYCTTETLVINTRMIQLYIYYTALTVNLINIALLKSTIILMNQSS
jgi:hypothetical protein